MSLFLLWYAFLVPQKNTIKEYAADSYYHVYLRGVAKQKIFEDHVDYRYFESLIERYLSKQKKISKTGIAYPNYRNDISLLSYCLMTNHLHLVLYQHDNLDSLKKFMASLLTSYSKYFNLRHKRVGSLFESRYKAKRIDNNTYLIHISRYVHMNPRRWQNYRYSSLQYVHESHAPDWLNDEYITSVFNTRGAYLSFLEEYQEHKDMLEDVKYQLAEY